MADTEGGSPAKAVPEAEDQPAVTSPTPIFGSGFSSSTGFGGFTGVTQPATTDADGEDDEKHPEEDCKAEFKPVVQLEEVEANTGEESEDCILEIKAKLYRFEQNTGEWKERGIGQAKFLKSKEHQKIRFLMRQDKTLKIRANHLTMPGTKLSTHAGNDKAWVWSAVDFADEEQKVEMFCIRFGSVERANEFKAQYEKSMDHNKALLEADGVYADGGDDEGEPPADSVAAEKAEKKAAVDEIAADLEKTAV